MSIYISDTLPKTIVKKKKEVGKKDSPDCFTVISNLRVWLNIGLSGSAKIGRFTKIAILSAKFFFVIIILKYFIQYI